MEICRNEQETFWAGEFGDQYIERNQGDKLLATNLHLFSTIFAKLAPINSMLEFGANIGMNIKAIQLLHPGIECSALEINAKATNELKKMRCAQVYEQALVDFKVDYPRDLVLTKGVLIHLSPAQLEQAYQILYAASQRYICIAEYYNPTPISIPYRNHQEKLFKRDFAGEMLDRFSQLSLVNYGFCYHRDLYFPQDDLTWFVLEKK
jgi:pseudaminic acid biosynthesis-associated methylase